MTNLITAPSISSSAMLVELNISNWSARKKDKRASSEVTLNNRAATGIANVNKKLLDCDELDAITKFISNQRNVHYSMTMPWSDSGLRLLPTAQYFKYQETMTALADEFYRMVDEFMRVYDWEISQAQAKLGDLFNASDYPSAESVRSKFAWRMNYMPLPDAGDFRVDIGNTAVDQLTTQYQTMYDNKLQEAMGDVWQRVYTALSKMSERLDYADHEKKKIFRDSLVENVLDMVELLRVCNVTQDSQMTAMADKLDQILRGVTPDALRENGHFRSITKRAVDDAIKSLPSLDL